MSHSQKTYTAEELKIVLEKHLKWLKDEEGGERADLSYADLSGANLSYANLSYANLRYANLRNADLREADLSEADLSGADLNYANLSYADLSYADLGEADLSYANLRNADLRHCIPDNLGLAGRTIRGHNFKVGDTVIPQKFEGRLWYEEMEERVGKPATIRFIYNDGDISVNAPSECITTWACAWPSSALKLAAKLVDKSAPKRPLSGAAKTAHERPLTASEAAAEAEKDAKKAEPAPEAVKVPAPANESFKLVELMTTADCEIAVVIEIDGEKIGAKAKRGLLVKLFPELENII